MLDFGWMKHRQLTSGREMFPRGHQLADADAGEVPLIRPAATACSSEAVSARVTSFQQIREGERSFSGAGRSLNEIETIWRKPAAQNVTQPRDPVATGRGTASTLFSRIGPKLSICRYCKRPTDPTDRVAIVVPSAGPRRACQRVASSPLTRNA
jgi:hypothetical protein